MKVPATYPARIWRRHWRLWDTRSRGKPPATYSKTQSTGRATLCAEVERQLGLKVEARKAPIEMLVVDHVDRVPTEN